MGTEKHSVSDGNGQLGGQPGRLPSNIASAHGVKRNGEDRTGASNFGTELLLVINADKSIETAITMLHRAILYAQDCQRAAWDFAVEFSDLQAAGISTDEIRWLVGKGLVEHAIEVTPPVSSGRMFDSIGGFTFNQRSCFVLTDLGMKLAALLSADAELTTIDESNSQTDGSTTSAETLENSFPSWDTDRHELKLGGLVVKRFKSRAANQIAILNAFQEEDWPARIDDPLPPLAESNSKRRLGDTIKCLNRRQTNALIRFSGDGTGEGVIWSLVDDEFS